MTISDPGKPFYLDATSEEFRETLAEMVGPLDGSCEFSFQKATSFLFNEIERKSGEKILLAKVLLGTPKGQPSIVTRDFQMAACYVVRQGGEDLIRDCRIAA